MNKRVALASGGALIAISILLLTFGTPANNALRDFKIIIIVASVLAGTGLQIYGTWPRRRHRYFTDDVWTVQREEAVQPKAKPKAEPKSVASRRRARQTQNTPSIPLADHDNDLTAN